MSEPIACSHFENLSQPTEEEKATLARINNIAITSTGFIVAAALALLVVLVGGSFSAAELLGLTGLMLVGVGALLFVAEWKTRLQRGVAHRNDDAFDRIVRDLDIDGSVFLGS